MSPRAPSARRWRPGPHLETLPLQALLRRINREDRRVAPAVGRVIPQIAAAVKRIVAVLRRGGRVIYVGAGTSGRLGWLDAMEVPPTFGVDPGMVRAVVAGRITETVSEASPVEDNRKLGREEMERLRVGPRDVVVGIAASGTTPFTLGAIAEARRRGAYTVGLTTTRRSPLAVRTDTAIVPRVGEEIVRGSTRMKAGTAQKLVLQMLSTATMVGLGHVYRDLMVDVRPLNAKLRRRVQDIVAAGAGVSSAEAARLVHAAGEEAKVALVMGLAGVDAPEARRLLVASDGFIRGAVQRARRTR